MSNSDLTDIQALIGYEFNNMDLLSAAFTHSSYVNEHPSVGNERIEFLGDCVLNFLVGECLFLKDGAAGEGSLSARRASIVSRAPLARIVDKLGLMRYLRVGAGVNKAAFSNKARSDLFESVLGAVYLDGGIDACRVVLEKIFYPDVIPEVDYVSLLNQYCVEHNIVRFIYPTDKVADGAYQAMMDVNGNKYFEEAGSKHDAEKKLAETVYKALTKTNDE